MRAVTWALCACMLAVALAVGSASDSVRRTEVAEESLPAPPSGVEPTVAVADPPIPLFIESTAPATAHLTAVRVDPPETTDPCASAGLYCQPFAPPSLSGCDEMNFYRTQAGLPDRWSDFPRTGPKRQQGIGWRESNCKNTANSHMSSGCCFGYWQIASSNITAPGYASAGVFSNCGVTSKWDYWGDSPLQKQKSACVAKGLYDYHTSRGEDAAWEVWDRWL